MKAFMYAGVLLAAGFLAACTATVQTYDGSGTLLGKCEAHRGLLFGGAHCVGSANPKDQTNK
jgi:hypothetical protein